MSVIVTHVSMVTVPMNSMPTLVSVITGFMEMTVSTI